MPSLNTVNPSPPEARKLFIVTRNESVGVTSTPLTHIRPILPAQVAAFGSDSYLNVDEICRTAARGRGASVHGAAAHAELLLQQPPDHVAGHRLRDEAVAERLDREGLAVRDLAGRFAARRDVADPQVRPDAARVHERELGAAEGGGLRRDELGVGDHVAERRLAERRRRSGSGRPGSCR